MKNDSFIQLQGTLSENQTSNKALRFDLIANLLGNTVFENVYMPVGQLDSLAITNKSKRQVRFNLPTWLYKQKIEEEQARQIDTSGFDQVAKLLGLDANRQYAEKPTDRLADEQ
jgi:hypothetical protein